MFADLVLEGGPVPVVVGSPVWLGDLVSSTNVHRSRTPPPDKFLVDRDRLESFEAEDLAALAEALIGQAVRRVETTAAAALAGGDVDGAYVAAYDA